MEVSMSNVTIKIGDFTLDVDVGIISMPIPERVNAMPEDCYPAEGGELEWEITKVEGENNDGLDLDELVSATGSMSFEADLWEALKKEYGDD